MKKIKLSSEKHTSHEGWFDGDEFLIKEDDFNDNEECPSEKDLLIVEDDFNDLKEWPNEDEFLIEDDDYDDYNEDYWNTYLD